MQESVIQKSRQKHIFIHLLVAFILLSHGFATAQSPEHTDNTGATTMPDYIDTANAVIAAWKNDDIEGVLALLDDEIEYHYFVGRPPLLSKDDIRQFLQTFGQGQKDKQWRINNYAVNGNKLLVEGVDDYVNKQGIRVQLVYMGIFEFRNGLIYRWRDYVDTAMAEKAKAGETSPDYIQALINK